MRRWMISALVFGLIFGCSSYAVYDPHWVLDPPAHNLRGRTPKEDRPESDCDPVKRDDGTLQYQCVVHTFPNYRALLKEMDRLRTELKACQQGQK